MKQRLANLISAYAGPGIAISLLCFLIFLSIITYRDTGRWAFIPLAAGGLACALAAFRAAGPLFRRHCR